MATRIIAKASMPSSALRRSSSPGHATSRPWMRASEPERRARSRRSPQTSSSGRSVDWPAPDRVDDRRGEVRGLASGVRAGAEAAGDVAAGRRERSSRPRACRTGSTLMPILTGPSRRRRKNGFRSGVGRSLHWSALQASCRASFLVVRVDALLGPGLCGTVVKEGCRGGAAGSTLWDAGEIGAL